MSEIKPVYQAVLEEGLKACEELFERDYFGNHNVKIEDFHPTRERFAEAAAAYEAQRNEVEKLKAENEALRKQVEGIAKGIQKHFELSDSDLAILMSNFEN